MRVINYDKKLTYAKDKLKELREEIEVDKLERINNINELEELKFKLRSM